MRLQVVLHINSSPPLNF